MRYCTAEVISEELPKAWVTPGSPKSTLHPLPRALPKVQKGTTRTQGSVYDIYLYIYNCSHFIVLNSLFTVDLTRALNNCRERPLE